MRKIVQKKSVAVQRGQRRRRTLDRPRRIEMDLPEFFRKLCAKESIHPFSDYVERSRWKLREKNVEAAFLDKMGIYCFWWTGRRETFLNSIAQYQNDGERYPDNPRLAVGHDPIPVYVGMTQCAARRDGNQLKGRMVDRLVRFPKGMTLWLSSKRESPLIKRRTGTCGNFELFGYPERIRARIAAMAGRPRMSLTEAQEYLDMHQSDCRELVAEFQEDYFSLMFDNYSISFVPFTDEWELFFAEALTIGLLRPVLNLS